ncbi:MAG TPA: IS3 family transposase [Gemmatimonas sp.]|nr:IS3 family transposase [Gemmatimonas sp.]
MAILVPLVGIVAACTALGVSRATFYRAKKPTVPPKPRPCPARALPEAERADVLSTLNSVRFADKAPAQVYATLLDEETFLCSIRTMYRILAAAGLVHERRNQRRHPPHVKPQLVARAPNQVWVWDITKVPGPERGVYYCLYVVLDIFSRAVVGWTIAMTESAELWREVVVESCTRHGITPGQLTMHADRGSPMTAKSTALLYADLGITTSHSRPRVSNDNAFAETAFKTLKYRPEMPDRFGSLEDARTFFAKLLAWYNDEHFHSGIALLTPADVHAGTASTIIAARQRVLDAAFHAHPERFPHGTPTHQELPTEVWINQPTANTVVIEPAQGTAH